MRSADRLVFAADAAITDNVTGLIAEVAAILELAAADVALMSACSLQRERLVEAADGRSDVFKFVVDIEAHFGQSNDHSEDSDSGDDHQFSRDDETSFVIHEASENCGHGCGSFLRIRGIDCLAVICCFVVCVSQDDQCVKQSECQSVLGAFRILIKSRVGVT